MDALAFVNRWLGRIPPRLAAPLERLMGRFPPARRRIEKEVDHLLSDLEPALRPYRDVVPSRTRLPRAGEDRESILGEMERLRALETSRWRDGFVSGAVYHGDDAHIDFLNRVYALHSQSNPLHADLWPSTTRFEAEVVSMTARMLGGSTAGDSSAGEEIGGVVTSGGTESILLAMKAYRDLSRARGVRRPEMVVPVTAHAAFDKASQYFDIRMVRTPVDEAFRSIPEAVEQAVCRRTAVIVGSAPSFPHGAVDPIEALSEIARRRGVGFHTDACLGGFVLPWADRLGYEVPPFDFRLPGVTSISADTHKYGYAAKGTSVILYRGRDLRHCQYYTATEWPGGLYFSPTFAGSRPGGLSAACWAALVSMGEEGYVESTRRILGTADRIKEGIRQIPELRVLGDPLWVIAFASDEVDIYRVLDFMGRRHWNLNGLHKPPAIHICVTLRHAEPGVADRFLHDLRDAVEHVRAHPPEAGGMAPVYGMAATLPFRGMVSNLLKRYIDLLYRP